MRVVEIETQDHQKRYVVIDDAGVQVEPIMKYLKYLDRIGAARNTLRSYATVLKQYWDYLSQQQLDWQQITLDDLARSSCSACSPSTFQSDNQSCIYGAQ
jgi:integrase/recombinase XerD